MVLPASCVHNFIRSCSCYTHVRGARGEREICLAMSRPCLPGLVPASTWSHGHDSELVRYLNSVVPARPRPQTATARRRALPGTDNPGRARFAEVCAPFRFAKPRPGNSVRRVRGRALSGTRTSSSTLFHLPFAIAYSTFGYLAVWVIEAGGDGDRVRGRGRGWHGCVKW